ncbi:MAG: ParB/RepB/Spo0J family partition protein, partial [Actinomycetota bacterium]|nr:ParB/RepB/Spo0J family partition protein [Actinomycetota bacterium]
MKNELKMVPLAVVRVSERNVRKNLAAGTEDGDVAELAASIEGQGLLNPPLLRETGDGHFEVIAGQRRVLACRRLGWVEVPSLVRQLDDGEALAASLSENVQRADMDPLDKARAIEVLEGLLGSLGAVATRLGLSLPTVRRYHSLVSLAPELQQRIGTGGGPARVGFLSRLADRFPDPVAQTKVYEKVA